MDAAPIQRPGLTAALVTTFVLLALLSLLIYPAFSGGSFLHTQDHSLSAWDHHFAGHGWDSHMGMGKRKAPLPPGITGAFAAITRQTSDPAANFANYYPPFCLFLLGMSAWYCVRQLGCTAIICGIGAVAAAFNGVFLTRAMEFSSGLAVAGASAFLTFGILLWPKLIWPRTLVAGLALGIAVLETGLVIGGALAVITVALARLLAHNRDGKNRLDKSEFLPMLLIFIVMVVVVLPVHTGPEKIVYPGFLTHVQPLQPKDWLTLPIAGFYGHRLDALDGTLHRGTIGSSSAHVGMIVLLMTLWTVINTFHKNSPYSRTDQWSIKVLVGATLLTLLGTLWQPHLIVMTVVTLVMLCALGLKGFDLWLSSDEHEKTRAFGGGGFDSAWRLGLILLLGAATSGFMIYGSHVNQLENKPALLHDMLSVSHWQLGVAVIVLFLSTLALIVCSLKKWTPEVRRVGLTVIGLVLAMDLMVGGNSFVLFDNNSPNISVDALADTLKERSRLGRLALLDEYQRSPLKSDRDDIPIPLDRLIVDQLLKPIPPLANNRGSNPEQAGLADAFFLALTNYQSSTAMRQFNSQAEILLMRSQDRATVIRAVREIQQLPGGAVFVRSDGNLPVIKYITNTAQNHERNLAGRETIQQLENRLLLEDTHVFAKRGIIRADNQNFMPPPAQETLLTAQYRESIRMLTRQWELASTRFFVCHAGNPILTEHIQAYFRQHGLPVYRNALNQVLDAAQRRFLSIGLFELINTGNEAESQFELVPSTNNPNATVGLMEFTGALPRATLFADWQTGIAPNNIQRILFSPGFNPHQRVLLEAKDFPAPEQPSQTPNLPPPVFKVDKSNHVELEVPPTDYAAVLLLNDRFHPDWKVTIDSQAATLLRANGLSRAVHLPASDQTRTVVFSYMPHGMLTLPSTAAVFIGLFIASIGSFRNWRQFVKQERGGNHYDQGDPREPDKANLQTDDA